MFGSQLFGRISQQFKSYQANDDAYNNEYAPIISTDYISTETSNEGITYNDFSYEQQENNSINESKPKQIIYSKPDTTYNSYFESKNKQEPIFISSDDDKQYAKQNNTYRYEDQKRKKPKVFVSTKSDKFREQRIEEQEDSNKKYEMKQAFHTLFLKGCRLFNQVMDIDEDVCKGKKELLDLLCNVRNDHILLNEKQGAFRVLDQNKSKSHVYRGLKERLKERLWKDTDENPFTRDKEDIKRRKTTSISVRNNNKAHYCKFFGSTHGSIVHKEIEDFVSSIKQSQKKYEQDFIPDMCTLMVINELLKKNLVPVESEFMIYDEDWRVATSIDIICFDCVLNELVIIETKTGYENETYGPHLNDFYLQSPFNDLVNCPLIRHLFQLYSSVHMLRKKYNVNVKQAYIIRSCPKKNNVQILELTTWFDKKRNQDNFDLLMMDHLS